MGTLSTIKIVEVSLAYIYLIISVSFTAIILISSTKVLIMRPLRPALVTKMLVTAFICQSPHFWKRNVGSLLYESQRDYLRPKRAFNGLHTMFQFATKSVPFEICTNTSWSINWYIKGGLNLIWSILRSKKAVMSNKILKVIGFMTAASIWSKSTPNWWK